MECRKQLKFGLFVIAMGQQEHTKIQQSNPIYALQSVTFRMIDHHPNGDVIRFRLSWDVPSIAFKSQEQQQLANVSSTVWAMMCSVVRA